MSRHNTWDKEANSLWSYLEIVNTIYRRWCKLENGASVWVWFRGHSDSRYSLQPSGYRGGKKCDEDSIRSDFRLKSFPYLQSSYYSPHSEWDFYFLMQHHGAPTRLLDWTEGALIALYFALLDATDDSPPAVWMLNPFRFNRTVSDYGEVIPNIEDRGMKHYLPEAFSSKPLPKGPVAFQPPWNSPRMVAQKSVFTIHGSSTKPLEDYINLCPYLVKIEIDGREREIILLEQLAYAGFTESNIYPDLPGLCRELKRWHQ